MMHHRLRCPAGCIVLGRSGLGWRRGRRPGLLLVGVAVRGGRRGPVVVLLSGAIGACALLLALGAPPHCMPRHDYPSNQSGTSSCCKQEKFAVWLKHWALMQHTGTSGVQRCRLAGSCGLHHQPALERHLWAVVHVAAAYKLVRVLQQGWRRR